MGMSQPWEASLRAAGFPERAVVLDFEEFFDSEYTLKKMSVVEFVADPRFELTGLGYAILEGGSCVSRFLTPPEIGPYLTVLSQHLDACTIVVANGKHDCLILRERFGIMPRYVVDVQDLARVLDARDRHDIDHLAKKYGAPRLKGDTMAFTGLHWHTMTPAQRESLAIYCRDGDVEIETYLFKALLPRIVNPEVELRLSNQTLRLFLEPSIHVNFTLGERLATEMDAQMQKEIDEVRALGVMCVEPPKFLKRSTRPPKVRAATAEDIRSNGMFIEMLSSALPDTESVPMKQGKKQMIPALAKSDEALSYLLVHPEPKVRALVAARVACKSWPAHIKRVGRIMDQARARGGHMGVPLRYYGAQTGRFSGSDGVNFQNLGAREVDELIKGIGGMLEAPEGYVFGVGDLSQIEARVLAWLSGQLDLVVAFAAGGDIYSDFAQKNLYHAEVRKPTKNDPPELAKVLKVRRDVGKETILGAGYSMSGETFYRRCVQKPSLRAAFVSGELTRELCHSAIAAYRSRYPKIVSYWGEIDKTWKFTARYKQPAIVSRAGRDIRFRNDGRGTVAVMLPSGRELYYPGAHVDSDGECSYKWGAFYGGLGVENLCQSVARDYFCHGLLVLEGAGFKVVGHVHDSAIVLLKKDGTETVRLAEMHKLQTTSPVWANGLPTAVEGSLCRTYH